jgi:8-oxo-dGTP pyrophosphatase MutT (NUDIX family)
LIYAAIARECQEELGTLVTVERLLLVREYIGANHQHAAIDSHLHIVDILFACSVSASYTPQLGNEPDFDQVGVEWLPLASLNQYRFYPAALQAYLMQLHQSATYIGDVN